MKKISKKIICFFRGHDFESCSRCTDLQRMQTTLYCNRCNHRMKIPTIETEINLKRS